ncbi:MAG TPA: TerC family protein [Solirubrobacteraceae bacterium]|nr:TerC family protein [Solirubrobacteraceae bacterium]
MPSPVLAATESAAASDLAVSAGAWAILGVVVVLLLAADLFVFGRGRKEVPLGHSIAWSVLWLLLALGFGGVIWAWQGSNAGSEYFAGYLLERSLSLDNIFVFAIIFSYFAVPLAVQPRVLGWGIALALVLRLIFILLGAALLDAFHVTFYAFGALLLYTAYKLARHDDAEIEPEHNPALRFLRRRVPMTSSYAGHRLTVREAGRLMATPLAAVFIVVATTDIVFAVDSIPAIFAITTEPFIVFAANAFAMLGLRALYFVLVGAMDRFAYLSYGLSAILAFIGVKMLLIDVWHPPIWLSLGVIVGVLVVTAVWSARATAGREPSAEASPRTRPAAESQS